MSIGTTTNVDGLPLGTSVAVTFATNGTALALWYDGTNVKAAYASSPYTSWTSVTVSAAGGIVASAHLDTSNLVNMIQYVSGGLSYAPISLSGTTYSAGSLDSIATVASGGNNLMGAIMEKDVQNRYWALATDRVGSNINVYTSTTPTTPSWTVNHTVAWSSDLLNNFPAGGITGNFLLFLYPTATSTFNYQRLDVHNASLGSWSSATAFTPGGSSVTYDNFFSFRGNSSAGVEANDSSTGIWARVYNPGADTWATAVQLSSGASDARPTVISGSDGNFYVVWQSHVGTNNTAIVYKKYTVATTTWDTSATTLVASGANNINPVGGSNNNVIGVLYQTGTASPYSINFASISLGTVVDHSWQMRGRVAILTDHSWQMRSRVSAVTDHAWSMRGNVSITTDHTWQMRGRVASLTDHSWQMRARLSTTADHRWQMRGNVGNTIDHAWSMRARLSGVADHRWQLRGNVAILTDHRWQLRANVGATADHRWSMRGRISSSTDHAWQMRGRVGALTDHLWSVRGRIGNVGTHHWPIRGGIGTTVPHRWQMRARVANSASHQWQMRGNVGKNIQSGGFTLWANGSSGTASFDGFRVTAYPDPSTSLASAGRAANSVANWNAVQPNNTELTVTTSTDNGVTYQAVAAAGNDIPGISTLLYSTLALQKKPNNHYHLTEAAGSATVADSSGNGYTGTVHGGVTLGVTGLLQGPGESTNSAAQFDGSSGYISFATTGLPTGASPWCLLCWCQVIAAPASGQYAAILAMGNNSTSQSAQLKVYNNGTFSQFLCSTYAGDILSPVALSLGTTYFLCATYDGTSTRLYINDQLVAGPTAFALNLVQNYASIGADGASPIEFFHGIVAEASILAPTLAAGDNILSESDIFAMYNAGLAAVGTTQSDSFTSDTSASYIQTFGTGGSAAAVTWDTTDSRLVLVGGSKAQVLFDDLWAYDTDILADFYQSENGGLVWGWQDASNYYELVIKDGGASSGANTMTLNKVVAGSSTQLATASIAFTAQTHRRFHLTMLSATIQVAIDGVATLAYTDTSPLPAGLAGVRNDTGTSYCYLLQIAPQPVDLSAGFLCTKQSLVTSDPTATPQITDHQSMASDKTFGVGTMISSIDNRQTMVSDNISNLVTQSNYWWRINDGSGVEFQPRDASDSPWILQPTDILTGSLPTVEYSADMYRNRQVLTGVFDTAQFTETRPGDGQTRSWSLSNPVVSPPTIWLNNNPVSVGINGTDTGKQYYYQPNNNTITQDNSQPILTETDLLKITYQGSYAIDFAIDNTGQIANTLSQAQMGAIDGTTGVTEAVEDVSQQNMDREAATTYGNQLLSRYGQIARTITFQTLHTGLKCGQSLPIFLPQYNIFDSVFLIVQVDTSVRTLATGDIQYVYSVTASEAAALSSWVKMFSKVMRGVTGTKVHVKA